MTQLWTMVRGDGPLVATAIHDGHELREEVAGLLALPEADRLREEDPYTGAWATVAPTHIVPRRSRFEVDLNRPRGRAVYLEPADAWGLRIWREQPPGDLVQRSLEQYDAFYGEAHRLFTDLTREFGCFVVLDLHSYNHRRLGPEDPPAAPEANPEVNVGTGSMDRHRWGSIVDRFIGDLRSVEVSGRRLDVRENVKFRGGNFPRWIHESFPRSGCALAVEFKKLFMDEWTGELDRERFEEIRRALSSTLDGLRDAQRRLAGPV